MSENVFIKEAWIYLSKLSRKIITTQSDMAELFKSEQWFQALLQALSVEYVVIHNVIDTQNNSDIKRDL